MARGGGGTTRLGWPLRMTLLWQEWRGCGRRDCLLTLGQVAPNGNSGAGGGLNGVTARRGSLEMGSFFPAVASDNNLEELLNHLRREIKQQSEKNKTVERRFSVLFSSFLVRATRGERGEVRDDD